LIEPPSVIVDRGTDAVCGEHGSSSAPPGGAIDRLGWRRDNGRFESPGWLPRRGLSG
jgi:hypothetical protein